MPYELFRTSYSHNSSYYLICPASASFAAAIAAKVGGGGGGRPNMAQAGGKNPAGIPDAIAAAKEALGEQIK